MRLKAAVEGSLSEYMEREYQNCARAVTKGVSLAANGLKTAMRTQVKSAGLGSRLANTWRGDVYPKAKNSVSAAGVVYTKAQKIMEGFEYQTVVRSKDGLWLAIPTAAISKRIRNKRMTPALYERSKGRRGDEKGFGNNQRIRGVAEGRKRDGGGTGSKNRRACRRDCHA